MQSENPAPPEETSGVTRLTPELMQSLRDKRVLREQTDTAEAELELPEAEITETVLGTIPLELRPVFIELGMRQNELEAFTREVSAAFLIRTGEALREKNGEPDMSSMFTNVDEAKQYFEYIAILDHLRGLLMYEIGLAHGFGMKIGFRKGFKIVRLGYKYDQTKVK